MNLYGLMITKNDEAIFGEWCRNQLPLYDAVVCLDGSDTAETERIARSFSSRLIYLHERDFHIPHKTDHGLRDVVHREIVQRFGTDNWIMCCHADEFCYHDPRRMATKAAAAGCDLVSWYNLHFVPHPTEFSDWDYRQSLRIQQRFRHYHWNHENSGVPWKEDRLYRNGVRVAWDGVSHASVRPNGIERPAPFCPILQHYKVFNTDMSWYEVQGNCTAFRHHWNGASERTGLPLPVTRLEELFVASLPAYYSCDRLGSRIPHSWNIGEEFRMNANASSITPLRQLEKPRDPIVERVNRHFTWVRCPGSASEVSIQIRGRVDSSIIEEIWQRDVYGLATLQQPPSTIIDIGAHIGVFSLKTAELFPQARVIACEADPDNLELLRTNLTGHSNVDIVPAAIVADDVKEVEFYSVRDKFALNSGGGSCVRRDPGSSPIRVPALSILELWTQQRIESCDLLKLDCEGMERALLKALREAKLLDRVKAIVGEWHIVDSSRETQQSVKAELHDLLGPTHDIRFGIERPGNEGYFTATRRVRE